MKSSPVIKESTTIWLVTVPEGSLPADGYAGIFDVLMANEMLPSGITLDEYEMMMGYLTSDTLAFDYFDMGCFERSNPMVCGGDAPLTGRTQVYFIGTLPSDAEPDRAITPEALDLAGFSGELEVYSTTIGKAMIQVLAMTWPDYVTPDPGTPPP